VKQIPIGGENFNRQIAAKLGINISEAEMLRGRLRMESGDRHFAPIRPPTDTEGGPLDSGGDSVGQGEGAGLLQEGQNGVGLDVSTRQVMVDALTLVAEELAREISLCFRYYTVTFRGNRVEEVVFAGGGAHESILLDTLRRQLGIEVEVAQPLRGFDLSSKKINASFHNNGQESHCEWAVAVGLSLKAGSESVNL
ncbi:MAG: pilus assembly protein PilM, partial [Planctomycetes bacterium]|nr:pilus assembly protein PilM [Planctomycetota bacterium]